MTADQTFEQFLTQLKTDIQGDPKGREHILLVTCIDLRYPGLIHGHMETAEEGWFHKKYDQMSLAGAGLAGVVDFVPHPKPNWCSTFVEHVGISNKLHNIAAVVVLEHRDCGAYREFGRLRAEPVPTEEQEKDEHDLQMARLADVLERAYPEIAFYSFLLDKEEHKTVTDEKAAKLPTIKMRPLTIRRPKK